MASKTPLKFALSGNLGLRDIAPLAEQLREAVAKETDIVVNAKDLTGIDITVVQALLAARKSVTAAGRSMRLEAPADGALARFLVKAGFVSEAGEALTPEGDFWTMKKGQAA